MNTLRQHLLPAGAIKISLPALLPYASAQKPKRFKPRGVRAAAAGSVVTIPDGSIYVDAPDLPQPTNYSCALAAASIARMYGVGPGSMEEFMKGMKTKRSGTYARQIVNYMNELGLDASLEKDMTR
ncbi:MAG: hypothetical protein K2X27_18320, partial [Candidatus Obscuribacterales bacterium]|nr:hypothetical protein [Candidatus Obscuribacterales bacterium]